MIISASISIDDTDGIRARAAQFDGVELSLDFVVHTVTAELLDEIRSIGAEHGTVFSVHAPFYDLNIGSPNDGIREVSVAETHRALEVAIAVGAVNLNVHPAVKSFFPREYWPVIRAREAETFRGLCDIARKHDLIVTVENLPAMPHHMPDSVDLSGQLSLYGTLNHPAFGICLDTGHAHQAGIEPADAVAVLGRSPGALRHVHAHDNHSRGEDEHLPIGKGTIDWPRFVAALRSTGYDRIVVLENRPLEAQLESLEAWNRLNGSSKPA